MTLTGTAQLGTPFAPTYPNTSIGAGLLLFVPVNTIALRNDHYTPSSVGGDIFSSPWVAAINTPHSIEPAAADPIHPGASFAVTGFVTGFTLTVVFAVLLYVSYVEGSRTAGASHLRQRFSLSDALLMALLGGVTLALLFRIAWGVLS